MAKLLTAWQHGFKCRPYSATRPSPSLECSSVSCTLQNIMRRAVEAVLGLLQNKECPSKQVIAHKLEMIESNMPCDELLTEIALKQKSLQPRLI